MSGTLDEPAPMISGPLEDSTSAPTQTTLDESLAATAASGFRSATEVWRNPAALNTNQAPGTEADQAAAAALNLGMEGPQYGAPSTAPPQTRMLASDANAENEAHGGTLTKFDHDTTQETFDTMLADNLANQKDADVISRSAAGIIASPARFATGLLVSLADPRNEAALLIPGIPEAGIAEALGGGMAARAVTRGGLGAAQNAAVGVGMAPLQYAQASADHEDFSWGETLRNAAYMAAFGALHGGIAGALDRPELPPETVNAAMKAGVARVMQDHPAGVDIQGLIDHADATSAADRLTAFQQRQATIDAARPGEPAPDVEALDRGATIAEHEQRLADLREQSVTFFSEAEAERASRVGVGNQDQFFSRVDEIDHRLSEGIPQAERDALETEKANLQAGGDALEQERSVAAEAGLRSASANAAARARETEGAIERLRAGDVDAQAQAADNRNSSDRSTRIKQLTLDSREQVLQALMEKEVRRYAYRTGVDLRPGEAETAAREIRTAGPGEIQDTIASHLNAIAKRSDAFPVRDAVARLGDPVANLRREAQGAAIDMATRAQNPTDPELAVTQQAAAQTIATAPKMEGIDVDKDTAEWTQRAADRKAEYDGMVQAGALAEHPTLADAGKAEAERGLAAEAYAKTCAFGG